MRIKVGDKWYDGRKEPVMIELTDNDKKNIHDMRPECTKLCEYPLGLDINIKEWMEA